MARIIYKEGCDGQRDIASIEGIEIQLLNGQKALIYPKYSEEIMLPEDKITSWKTKDTGMFEALKKEDNLFATYVLLSHGSPAARFVAQFRTDKDIMFALPTLLASMAVQHQKSDIDELAGTIEGADLLRDFDSNVWSCSRYGKGSSWVAYGGNGFVGNSGLYCSRLAVPVVLYR